MSRGGTTPLGEVPEVLQVVFVCTGNRARSPLAEALFRRYSAGMGATVSSAGTLDVGALPPLEHAVEAGRRLGVDLSGHRARAVRTVSLADVDLVLGFEPPHVASAIAHGGASADRTFLLGELALLLHESSWQPNPVVRARAEVAHADARRVRLFPHSSEVVIADPLGKAAKVMFRTATEIDRQVRRVVLGLFGDLASSPPL